MPGHAKRRRGGDQHRRHDHLGQNGADNGVGPRRRQILHGQLFLDHGALLEENHPGHDDRADIGRHQIEILPVAPRDIQRLRRDDVDVGAGEDDHHQKHQFKGADRQGDALNRQIGMGIGHQQQRRRDEDHGRGRGHAHQRADAGEAGQFGEQRAQAADQQGQHGEPGPEFAKMLFDQVGVSLPRGDADPHGQFLHHVKHGNQSQLQPQQAIAPGGAALRGGDDAAGVGVGQHDHHARPRHHQKIAPPFPGWQRFAHIDHFPRSHKIVNIFVTPLKRGGKEGSANLENFQTVMRSCHSSSSGGGGASSSSGKSWSIFSPAMT